MREPRWLPLRLTHQGALMTLVITSTKVAIDENVDTNVTMTFYLQDTIKEVNRAEGRCSKSFVMDHQARELDEEMKAQK